MPEIGNPDLSEAGVTLDERTRALKERIYATFTGLAILAELSAVDHTAPAEAALAIAVGVLGISAAGFLAEVIAHQVARQALPGSRELRIMLRIAAGALGTASAPIVLLVLAWAGVLSLEWALRLGIGAYAVTLVVVLLLAARRSGLKPLQQLISAAMLLSLALAVVVVLLLAHLL